MLSCSILLWSCAPGLGREQVVYRDLLVCGRCLGILSHQQAQGSLISVAFFRWQLAQIIMD